MAFPLAVLFAVQAAALAGVLAEHEGRWLGEMKVPNGPTLKIGADLFKRADGSYWASLASPDQGAYAIPVKRIKEDGNTLELDVSFAEIKLTWEEDHFNGEFNQRGAPLPLTLRKVAEFPMRARPQTPKGPYPYTDQTVAIASTAGVTLGATLSLPKGKVKPDVVVLVHGSGPGSRDAVIAGHQPFNVLADHLARQGIAVLRYDKRGVERSTGDYDNHTFPQLADDLQAVVQTLRSRKAFRRIGIIGLSEGPGIAATVAARRPELVDFLVSLAGVGLSGIEGLVLQDRIHALDHKASPAEADQLMVYVRKYYETIMEKEDVEQRIEALKALLASLTPENRAMVEKYKMNVGSLSHDWARKPYLRAGLLTDVPAAWRGVRCPVLALNGSLDHQVPAKENLAGIVGALRAGGNTKVESAELAALNHLFQTATTGADDEYARIEETMAPDVLRRITAFVGKQR